MRRQVKSGPLAGVGVLTLAAVVQMSHQSPRPAAAIDLDEYRARTEIVLPGTFRDFKPHTFEGGHADFAQPAVAGFGRYQLMVEDVLDEEARPVFRSTGHKVSSPWASSEGTLIGPLKDYVARFDGDVDAVIAPTEGGTITTPENFAQWYRDDEAFNTTDRGIIRLIRQEDNTYLFDGDFDDPANGIERDYDFASTYEIDTTFIHERGNGWYIDLRSDGDYWMFINNRLVVDGGAGVQAPFQQPGIVLDGGLSVANQADIRMADGTAATVSTNATGEGIVDISGSGIIHADVLVGPGGDPTSDVETDRDDSVGGDMGVLSEPIEIPPVVVPTDITTNLGAVHQTGTFFVLDQDIVASSVRLDEGTTLGIRGDVRLLCTGDFGVYNSSRIVIGADSSLELYVGGKLELRNSTIVNENTQDPSVVSIFVYGTQTINLDNGVQLYAHILAPDAGISVGNNVDVFGSFFGESMLVNNNGQFTVTGEPEWSGNPGDPPPPDITASQRIELDRLDWLADERTYRLRIFFAERARPRSSLRIETNILTLNLAIQPRVPAFD